MLYVMDRSQKCGLQERLAVIGCDPNSDQHCLPILMGMHIFSSLVYPTLDDKLDRSENLLSDISSFT